MSSTCLDHAADLVVGVGPVGGEDVDLADEQLLLVGRQLIPLLQQVVGPGRQLGVLRDHAELLLVGEDRLAQLVPALVEQVHVADLLDPLRRRVVRRVDAAGHVVDEERLVRVDRGDALHVVDRVVGHRGDQVPARVADVRIDRRGVAEQVRLPLVGVAADEAVEVVEAHAGRPLVERPGLARLELGRVVVLAEPRGPVAVVLQDPADRRLVPRHDAVVAGVAGRLLGDDAEAHRVVVAPGDQRGARRRAQRRRVEVGVAQAVRGDAVEVRRRDHAAEGAGDAEAGVVGHDQQHVRRALGRHDARGPVRLRLRGVALDLAVKLRRGRRKLLPGNRRRGLGRARRRLRLRGIGRGLLRRCPEDDGAHRGNDLHALGSGHRSLLLVGLPRSACHLGRSRFRVRRLRPDGFNRARASWSGLERLRAGIHSPLFVDHGLDNPVTPQNEADQIDPRAPRSDCVRRVHARATKIKRSKGRTMGSR